MAEYAFDVVLRAALRVPNMPDEATARAELAAMLDAAYSNFGLWSNGEPILGEASIADDIAEPRLFEVDGVDVAPGSYFQPIGEVQYSMVWRDGSSLWHVQKNGIHFYETASFEDALQCCKDQDDFAGELSIKWPDMYVPHVAQPAASPATVPPASVLDAFAALLVEVDSEIDSRRYSGNGEDWRGLLKLYSDAKSALDTAALAIPSAADDVARAVMVIDGNEELSDWVREFLNREDMRADDVDRVRGTCRAIMEEAELAIPPAADLARSRKIEELETALSRLLDDVYATVDFGMPFSDPEHGFHDSVTEACRVLGVEVKV